MMITRRRENSDREPMQKTITVYTGYGTGALARDGVKVFTVKKELLSLGKEEITKKCEEISKQFDEIAKLEADILSLRKAKKCTKKRCKILKK